MIMAFNMTQSYFPFSVLNTGIAVAAAFCAYESSAVTLPTELAFGVTANICTCVFCYWGGKGGGQDTRYTCTNVSHE